MKNQCPLFAWSFLACFALLHTPFRVDLNLSLPMPCYDTIPSSSPPPTRAVSAATRPVLAPSAACRLSAIWLQETYVREQGPRVSVCALASASIKNQSSLPYTPVAYPPSEPLDDRALLLALYLHALHQLHQRLASHMSHTDG